MREAFVFGSRITVLDRGRVLQEGTFADLAVSDGFSVYEYLKPFTVKDLPGNGVLVIANALGSDNVADSLAGAPAFTPQECDAVRSWVESGGALLLISLAGTARALRKG